MARESYRVRISGVENVFNALKSLQELLGLSSPPRIIECFDVAVFQGSSPTASKVVFKDGRADKSEYRYYHLKELPEKNNDFLMLEEAISRRLKDERFPDLFLIDGGIGQVNRIVKVLEEKNIEIPVVGIAKEKVRKRGTKVAKSEERLIIPGRVNPYILKRSPLMKLIVEMRDESHRFARKLHHNAEKKRVIPTSKK